MTFILVLLLVDIAASFFYWWNLSQKLQLRDEGGLSQGEIHTLEQKLKTTNDALDKRLKTPPTK